MDRLFLLKRSNQLGHGEGQRSGPGRFGYVGQGNLPFGHAGAVRLTCGDLQASSIGGTGIDLYLHLQGRPVWHCLARHRERAAVEPPAGKLDPQAIEEGGQRKRLGLAHWRQYHHRP
jgi:hypothetical protein